MKIIDPINPDDLPLEIWLGLRVGKWVWDHRRETTAGVYLFAILGAPYLIPGCANPLEGQMISKNPCDWKTLPIHTMVSSIGSTSSTENIVITPETGKIGIVGSSPTVRVEIT